MGDENKMEVLKFKNSGVKEEKNEELIVRKNGEKGELDDKIV
jgi:hypothetical protein